MSAVVLPSPPAPLLEDPPLEGRGRGGRKIPIQARALSTGMEKETFGVSFSMPVDKAPFY